MRHATIGDFGRRASLAALAAGLVLASLVARPARAQEAVSVDQLRHDFDTRHKNELVLVRGWVDTERRVSSATFKGFYLKDRFGALVLVRTTKALPDITAEIQVKGVAIRDADTGDIFLSEVNREVLTPQGAAAPDVAVVQDAARRQSEEARKKTEEAQRQSQEAQRQAEEAQRQAQETQRRADEERKRLQEEQDRARAEAEQTRRRFIVALVAVGALAVLAGAAMLFRRRRPAAEPSFGAGGQAALASGPESSLPAPDEGAGFASTLQDFRTVKVYKTTKVLPGRLVVIEGGQDTDVIPLSDQSGRGEVEIGRDSPDVTGGIRIKDRTNTLSRHQARLTYDAGKREFRLVNLAGDDSNPTLVNGRQMAANESQTLKDGDLLTMGGLQARFSQR